MDMNGIFADIQFLIDHTYKDQEQAVRRWSALRFAKDYQAPIAITIGAVMKVCALKKITDAFDSSKSDSHRIMADIMLNSALNQLFEIDDKGLIKLKKDIPYEILDLIAEYIGSHSGKIVESRPLFPNMYPKIE